MFVEDVLIDQRDQILAKQDNDNNTYSRVPVSEFGLSMLEKMGWQKDKPIGKNIKNALLKPVEYIPRPAQAGLGSIEQIKQIRLTQQQKEEQDNNQFKKFTEIYIIKGKHKDMKGIILDQSDNYFNIELKCNGEKIKVQKEYISLSKQERSRSRSKSLKKLKWVQVGIRVKVKSKKYQNGKYYNQKITINDVVDEYNFIGLAQDHNILEDLSEKDIKPTLPKKGGKVVVLQTQQLGIFVEKKNKKEVIIRIDDKLLEFNKKQVCSL